jgi:hypothetical protein
VSKSFGEALGVEAMGPYAALGRVSDDPALIDVLLENIRNAPVPLFRDRAACALAYHQVRLAPAQKLRLFEGLIGARDLF